ncbi:MAG: bifunctional oligoribonuclease/PAP phosphatase NrnA [Cytophagaceae bacterium]|nr:bifunctional oligoribonuclease/PAP phosphatase NrnA [Cytophagaceae bacterium]MDW8457326.1 bifunctional oligoribonuclease/PAP phosphatase NrnA [Cytophagaceae bacterium]
MQQAEALKTLIQTTKKSVITTHHKPDADALGSSLALKLYLEKKGHQVHVVSPTDYPEFLYWMPGNDTVLIYEGNQVKANEMAMNADVIFCVDFNALSRINNFSDAVKKSPAKKVMIDHHLQPEDFADIVFSDPSAASTTQILYELIKQLGDEKLIDVNIAECLYAGVMTDTGSFRHSNTNKKVHEMAAALMDVGISSAKIHQLIFDNNSELRLRLLGYSISQKLTVLENKHTAYITLSAEELERYKAKTGDTEGLVNYALSIKGIELAALIVERPDCVRMSFRSRGDFDVNEFARQHFSGGGHKNAAGGCSSASLEDTVKKFVAVLNNYNGKL